MPKHPLTTLRFKIAKTTIFLPVTSTSTLSTLRETLISALRASNQDSSNPELEFSQLQLPESGNDIAFWRLEPPSSTTGTSEGGGETVENWIRLKDEKTSLEKLGLREAEEIGISFKDSNGQFPLPTVVRPLDDDYEEVGMEEQS
ncbi:hypothetical protein JCM5350_004233 [Sporobolomyces pararoseus]